jgi:chromosome segregation ATPase
VVVQTQSSSGFLWFTFLITLVAVSGAAYALWQLNQAQQLMQTQSQRIAQLEDKLAVSDDSATQSLTSLGVKVKDVNAQLQANQSEIAKLWDTRKVNRTAIANSDKKIVALAKQQKTLQSLPKKLTAVDKKISALSTLKTFVDSTSQSVAEHDLLLQSVRERVANNSESMKILTPKVNANTQVVNQTKGLEQRLDKRIKNTEEAITSFDAFRRNVNRDLLQLKQPQQ